jgi:hypothetical protein
VAEKPLQKNVRALERALAALQGVRRAKVETDDYGITGVRVLVAPERAVKETIDEVRGTAESEIGVELEPARIQVLSSTELEAGRSAGRRKLSSLSTQRSDDHFRAQVTLGLGDDALVGEVEVPVGLPSQYHSVARAVLEAIDDLLDRTFDVNSVEVLSVGDSGLVVVSLVGDVELLLGSALVKYDEYDAIARATLHALNRLLFESDSRVPQPA